jgi:NDP-sugar pyrophosphorylase family protein
MAQLAPRTDVESGLANEDRHVLIVCGGKGVRLRPYTTVIPKPLVPIGDRYSILEIVMLQLAACGFKRATLAIGHLGHLIRAYVGDGSQWGLSVDYAEEESPLGTIGPALMIMDRLPDHFLLMNGDVLTDLDYADLLDSHIASGAPLTVATNERVYQVDFGVLDVGADHQITAFTEKPPLSYTVSMGVYAISKSHLERYTPGLPYGFDEVMCDLIKRENFPASYQFNGFWLDIGRPEDSDRAPEEFAILAPRLLPGAR